MVIVLVYRIHTACCLQRHVIVFLPRGQIFDASNSVEWVGLNSGYGSDITQYSLSQIPRDIVLKLKFHYLS